MPIIEFYGKQEKVRRIDANKNPDEVYEDVVEVLGGYLGGHVES